MNPPEKHIVRGEILQFVAAVSAARADMRVADDDFYLGGHD